MNVPSSITAQGEPDRFGYEWANYSEIVAESKNQLQQWLGSLPLKDFSGKSILDAGCGMGRNSYWFKKTGATQILAIDASTPSIQSARRNLSEFKDVQVLKESIYDLNPKKLGTFDRVVCIGVLHHLAEPEIALKNLWRMVAPNGRLILWCYAKEGNERILPVIGCFRFIGSKLPIQLSHLLGRAITPFVYLALKLFPWRTSYYQKLLSLSYQNIESIVFDQILPKISNYWSRSQMQKLANSVDGEIELEFVQENSWAVRITRST
jgi:2-polyprenyl-3-methyl-5-hydroxy-6-metoxy-1,4-benzoquinol methylase